MFALIARRRARLRRKAGERDQQRPGQHEQPDRDIRPLHGLSLGRVEARALRRRHRAERRVGMLDPRQDQIFAHQQSRHRPDRVERLRQVQPPRAARGIAQHGDERVGRCLQEREAAGDHEQREQEQLIGLRLRRRIEEQRADRIEDQPDDHTRLVPEPPADQPRRQRQHEIAHVEGRLDQARLQVRKRERLAELLNQDVVQIVGHPPQEEQAGNQHQRPEHRTHARHRSSSLQKTRPALCRVRGSGVGQEVNQVRARSRCV